ncbi:hypothetical protein [[Phormidium] sp. ETS-05]|uniref:hypothetical protein n=1 Tax=[Phormidium] sp. ETS-05 TaxID=222819 RepID=UPI0018EECF10|nr:hypothetical protein [[Phormidium] sp. ETS-05]
MQPIIIRWEKLRLLLNFILALFICVDGEHLSFDDGGIYDSIFRWVVYAIIANVFYNVCPIIDIYFAAWNIDIGDWRYILVTVAIFSICIPYIMHFFLLFIAQMGCD